MFLSYQDGKSCVMFPPASDDRRKKLFLLLKILDSIYVLVYYWINTIVRYFRR